MATLRVSKDIAQRLEDLSAQTELSIDEVLLRLLDNQTIVEPEPANMDDEDVTWTDEEIAEMLKPKKPLTGKEMVEGGFIGGWEDMGIEGLTQQKAKRRKKYQW